jgi:hypothetical protein
MMWVCGPVGNFHEETNMTPPRKKQEARVKDLPKAPIKNQEAKDVKGGRQTPQTSFGDRMKAGLDTSAE